MDALRQLGISKEEISQQEAILKQLQHIKANSLRDSGLKVSRNLPEERKESLNNDNIKVFNGAIDKNYELENIERKQRVDSKNNDYKAPSQVKNFNIHKAKTSNDIPLMTDSKIYLFGERVDINENRQNEFKCFRSHFNLEELIEKYVCSFLNSKGGTLYLGINDDGIACGVRMDRKSLDDLSITFDRKLKGFSPPVRADQYSIRANYMYDNKKQDFVKDFYVIEIQIVQGDPCELYFTDKNGCYIRKQASSIFLQPNGIKYIILTFVMFTMH